MALSYVLYDFANWTGWGGIVQIAYAFNTFVRILWIVIITILCAVGIYFAYVTIKTYLSHPMDVVTALNYDTQVTIFIVALS
jgi:hypothetical protein